MPRLVRLAVALVLAVALAAPALAAPPAEAEPRPDLLVSLWNLLTCLWSDNGCEADPSGAALDNGCQVDPQGRCVVSQDAATTSDNGCWIDPSGRCIG